MQRLDDDSWVISASDLTRFLQCPWSVARVADEKLGKAITVPQLVDPMVDLVARLGLVHEHRVLEGLRIRGTVTEITYDRSPPGSGATAWREAIGRSLADTLRAIASDTDAIFQATLFEPQLPGTDLRVGFQGFIDFLVRDGDVWQVWDTKLARRAKEPALLQLAAYGDQLRRLGVATSPEVRLVLGDNTHSVHALDDLLGPYRATRDSVLALIGERMADPEPTSWWDSPYPPCGSPGCGACSEAITLHDDLFQIAGLRKTQRQKLLIAGLTTMTTFAATTIQDVRLATGGIGPETLQSLHRQASMQVATRHSPTGRPAWELLSPAAIASLPRPSAGDIFFDFEGDPTYQEFDAVGTAYAGSPKSGGPVWFGIDYLFGVWGENVNPEGTDPSFLPLWAENFAEERHVFELFCDLVAARLEHYPDMHIYHYAPYERTTLKKLRRRHNTALDCIETLLDGVLVDLYPVVTKGVTVGLPRYGLKSLELLYFDKGTRTGIAGGGESVVAFLDYCALRAEGKTEEASVLKDSIVEYNRMDCFSTQALRDWLITTVAKG